MLQAEACDLLIVLGGPIGVYETDAYPFLVSEVETIHKRLAARKPMLGICLGAQLMAAALGARVYTGTKGPEVGWFPIQYSGRNQPPAWFAPLVADRLLVFHWHGDTFDLPAEAQPLARTKLYENQAFTVGVYGLALQFHPEVTANGLERWYVGHASELASKRLSVKDLRDAGIRNAPQLGQAAKVFWNRWLDHIL